MTPILAQYKELIKKALLLEAGLVSNVEVRDHLIEDLDHFNSLVAKETKELQELRSAIQGLEEKLVP